MPPAGERWLNNNAFVPITMKHSVTFTILTPTFNRAHTLRRAFDSICAQTFKDFEWLVIDDGSADDTRELIHALSVHATFPIQYVYQINGGKHRAHNAALEHLRGRYTVILDSDDELTPSALEVLEQNWQLAERQNSGRVAAILGRSILGDHRGTEIQSATKLAHESSFAEGHHFFLATTGQMPGDRLPCYRSDILRKYPFPARAGDNSHVMEGVVWLAIGEDFVVRCINSVVRIYNRDPGDALSLMTIEQNPRRNVWGKLQYSLTVLSIFDKYFGMFPMTLMRHSANVTRFKIHCGYPIHKPDQNLSILARIALLISAPAGVALWAVDQIRAVRHAALRAVY